jgi:hypothetical protein
LADNSAILFTFSLFRRQTSQVLFVGERKTTEELLDKGLREAGGETLVQSRNDLGGVWIGE